MGKVGQFFRILPDMISELTLNPNGPYTLRLLIDAAHDVLLNLIHYGECQCLATTAPVRGNVPPGYVVGTAAAGLPGFLRIHRLFHVGGISPLFSQWKSHLLVRGERSRLSVAVFLAGNFWNFAACSFRAEAGMVAIVDFFLSRAVDFVGAGRFSFYLLLLSRRVLQGVLGGPDQLRGR